MGCGCGKNKNNRRVRIIRQRAERLKTEKKSLKSKIKELEAKSPLSVNASLCLACPESKQTPAEKKKGIRVCRKTNRLINNIIRDPRFVCPIGKWRNTK